MVTLTDRARRVLAEHLRANGARGYGLKLYVVAGGCAGFSYDLHFVARPAPGDHTFGDAELPVYVDASSLPFVSGTEIDYRDDAIGKARGFAFDNPRSKSVCSCGSSFEL